jgi:hypothetical protein
VVVAQQVSGSGEASGVGDVVENGTKPVLDAIALGMEGGCAFECCY